MAAGKCKAAYHTDEWHGYGPDAESQEEENENHNIS